MPTPTLHAVSSVPQSRYVLRRRGRALPCPAAAGAAAAETAKKKYAYPKYCVKMATGTGKTWVMHALLIWQYLNARAGAGDCYTKNFLFVAPGLIVYEWLLDAFCGKRSGDGEARDFATGDIKSCESLFVPPQFREALYGFLQNSLVKKENFGRKTTGDGTLAVMNWHAFLGEGRADGVEQTAAGRGGFATRRGELVAKE